MISRTPARSGSAELVHLSWRDVPPGDGQSPIPTSLLGEEAAELGRLAAGRDVLEIGSAHGYSACVMALAGARHVTAVDNHAGNTWLGDTRTSMQGNLDACGVAGRVTIVQSDSRAALAALGEQGRKFGLILVDGDHTAAGATADINGCLPLLGEGAVLAVHDYGETCCCPDVKGAVDAALGSSPARVAGTLWLRQF
jgi:cephalosporin hydroxylase